MRRIQIKGGGWYGCHLALALGKDHAVFLTEKTQSLFAGASGANPARLHAGPHYPRSHATRLACRAHHAQFMETYGEVTRPIPHNLYAVAAHDSLLDFETYRAIIAMDIPVLNVERPQELGLRNVEGAIQVQERHMVIAEARKFFETRLRNVEYGTSETLQGMDVVIDCTFCSEHGVGAVRFEPCLTVLLSGPTDIAVTVMDGPFPSLYPWDEAQRLSSLTSALYTPIDRCFSRQHAECVMKATKAQDLKARAEQMVEQMAHYYPAVRDRRIEDLRTAIRAQPPSGADARICKVERVSESIYPFELAIRAGKIDAVFEAERAVRAFLEEWK